MEKKKSKLRKYIIIIVVIAVIIGGYLYISSNAKKIASSMSDSYIVENTAQIGNIDISFTGNGVVEPISRVEIPKNITGEVKTSNFKEGDTVKKDSILYKIEGTNIKSPVNGTLITKNVEKGDYITANTSSMAVIEPLAVVADISKMKVIISVDEIDIGKVEIGMKAEVSLDAVIGNKYDAIVTKVASEGKSENGITTFDVTIEIENPEGLKIGMNADVEIKVQTKENVIRIPMDAINKDKGETYVYVKDETYIKDENKKGISFKAPSSMSEVKGYSKKNVEVGMNNKDYIEIISGISQGEKVYLVNTSKSLTDYMTGGMGMSMEK